MAKVTTKKKTNRNGSISIQKAVANSGPRSTKLKIPKGVDISKPKAKPKSTAAKKLVKSADTAMRNAKHRAEFESTVKGIHRNGKILGAVAAKKKKKKY